MKQKFEESLPDYETYKNMSYIIITPKETSKKTPLKKSEKSKKDFKDKINELLFPYEFIVLL